MVKEIVHNLNFLTKLIKTKHGINRHY